MWHFMETPTSSKGPAKERLRRLQDILDMPSCLGVRPLVSLRVVHADASDNCFAEAAV